VAPLCCQRGSLCKFLRDQSFLVKSLYGDTEDVLFVQKASATGAAVVSDYIAYLDKGQIPPKVLNYLLSCW